MAGKLRVTDKRTTRSDSNFAISNHGEIEIMFFDVSMNTDSFRHLGGKSVCGKARPAYGSEP